MAQDGRIDANKNARPEDGARVKDGVSGNTTGAVTPNKETVKAQGAASPKGGKASDVVKKTGG
jgi:hypothetical protein